MTHRCTPPIDWPSIPERYIRYSYIRFGATSVKAQIAALRTERKYSGRERECEYKTFKKTIPSRVHPKTTIRMKTQFILIACLTIAGRALSTQVYETPSDFPQKEWESWKNQDSIQVASVEQENFRPVTFENSNTQKNSQQPLIYNANIQSGASGVAEVLKQKQSVESIIDDILVSNRQGRNLEGYDEVYSDPNVKNALTLGNDTIARTYIKDKLCSLGLMNCEDVEGRRPYYSPHRDIYPHDVIYAQPVTIKPVGHPLPAIPVKRPPYGAAKPVPLPSSFGSPLGPGIYPGPGPFKPPPSFIGPYPGYKKPGLPPPFVSKPIYEQDIEPDFEDKFIDKKQVVLHQPGSSGVQQHVHHHYHHGEGATIGAAHNPVVVSPALGSNGLGNYGYGNGGTYGTAFNGLDDYKKAFKVQTPTSNSGPTVFSSLPSSASSSGKGYADRYPTYEKPNGKQFGASGQFISNNQFSGNGDYQFNGADNSFSSTSYEDCVCVPYDQCSTSTVNHVGRKDDLYLAIDPRNLDKDIDADTVEAVVTDGNGTMTIVRVPKGVNATEQIEQAKNEKTREAADEAAEVTKRNRRDVKHVSGKNDKQEIQERLTIGTGNLDTSKLNVRPTWGISFGLPQTGGVGPIAPHPGNPLGIPGYSPGHGLAGGGQGINLGPVSVNPLVAVQVTKDEYGEKVVKPYVNLHVTPHPALVHKLGHLLAYKKHGLYGGHYGGHYGGYSDVYAPHYHTHHERPVHHYPSRPPFYPVSHGVHQHYPNYHKPHYPGGYYPTYHKDDDYDYDYSDYDYADDYYRSARVGNATKGGQLAKDAPRGPTAGGERQTSGKITFSDRRKRDTTTFSETRMSERQFGRQPVCGSHHVCCRRSHITGTRHRPQCGVRNTQGINGRIKTPVYIDGDSEFGEYPWQVAILKKDPQESVYVCGGTLISPRHIITAAHCIKTHSGRDLRARLGEWDVNHDVEFYPYIERDIVSVSVHPEFYAGTLANDLAILKLDHDVDFVKNPHISVACLPSNRHDDFIGTRCWTTGWGKDAFGDYGKYQNILKEVNVPVLSNYVCEEQMRKTRLGPSFSLHKGFICAGGEEGKDACKGDGGGPMVCERQGHMELAGIVSWGIGCGQAGVPGVYVRVSHYLDWINDIINYQ